MNEKIVKITTYLICILLPLFLTYIVISIIYPVFNIYGIIVVSLIEYFGFQYIIALFIKRFAEAHQRKQQQRLKHQQETMQE